MTWWTITPRDPLVIRDGRPNESAQSQSSSLPFVPPQTMAGAARTRLGSDHDGAFVETGALESLKQVAIRGPLLGRLRGDGSTLDTLFVPPPKDAVLFGARDASGRVEVHRARRLRPVELEEHVSFDLDFAGQGLRPLDLEGPRSGDDRQKPIRGAAWWTAESLGRWLSAPSEDPRALGLDHAIDELPRDRRVHVGVDRHQGTATDGKLFQTDGLSFVDEERHRQTKRRVALRQYTLVASVTEWTSPGGQKKSLDGIGFLGGEKRWARWAPLDATLPLATPLEAVLDAVNRGDHPVVVRVVLLTPAWFREGWRPAADGPLLRSEGGVSTRLVAARVERPETISGWSLEPDPQRPGKPLGPKPTRRLVPAGCVYWVELTGTPEAREAWLRRQWMQNISDGEQERADGFGLAVVGVE